MIGNKSRTKMLKENAYHASTKNESLSFVIDLKQFWLSEMGNYVKCDLRFYT